MGFKPTLTTPQAPWTPNWMQNAPAERPEKVVRNDPQRDEYSNEEQEYPNDRLSGVFLEKKMSE